VLSWLAQCSDAGVESGVILHTPKNLRALRVLRAKPSCARELHSASKTDFRAAKQRRSEGGEADGRIVMLVGQIFAS
jgi:hypothetical protein